MENKFKNKYKISSTRLQNWDYGWNASYFVTINTKNRVPFFGEITNKKMQLSTIGEIANVFWLEIPQHFPFVKLGEFIIMPDHIHGVITIDKPYAENDKIALAKENTKTKGQQRFQNQGENTLSSIVGSFKSVVTKHAHKINSKFKWQPLFNDKIIPNKEAYKNIAAYIKANPSKWKQGKDKAAPCLSQKQGDALLWNKGYTIENAVEKFTVGNDRALDMAIAQYDLLASKAHTNMLCSIGIISKSERSQLITELNILLQQVEDGSFIIEEAFEDVHSKIEYELTKKLGDAGKKVHTGRSRNDQVLVALHLNLKDEIVAFKQGVESLFSQLQELSEQYKEVLIPGYTHMQVAMPSSIGLWLGAYAELLIDDIHFLNAAYKVADQNPLGSGAGYGSSIPLNRTQTTKELGMATLKFNSVAAQLSRGKLEKAVSFAMASVASTLSRLAMDVTLYMNENHGFISFPKELTTGSSIMPHKKNPDVLELVRAKCNKIQALPTELTLITNNLPTGYHRDYQLLKESLFPAITSLKDCLDITGFMFSHLEVNESVILDSKYDLVFSVEAVNKLVNDGIPFRDAYQQVGKQIEEGNFVPNKKPVHTHEGSIGNLCNLEIKEKFRKAMEG
ncbi:MAG: argininosuccinate lyase [Cyclobacteriaceae bacterium]|nr:argininosuccinate lyase [Cyclobacteriaceae bacterium]